MDLPRSVPGHGGTAAIREAVRSQIVGHGLASSIAIAAELDLRHATVVRVLQRFAAVGALALAPSPTRTDAVEVVPGSLADRFRNTSVPLW